MNTPRLGLMTGLPMSIAVVVAFFLGGWSFYQHTTPEVSLFSYVILYALCAASGVVLFLVLVHLCEKFLPTEQATK